ncbi:MAG: hypothetical protein SH847_17545, partial [Roseiflexaceae bacterium]|nr:hypothetical protein [Roseiflexaceae bacterium]
MLLLEIGLYTTRFRLMHYPGGICKNPLIRERTSAGLTAARARVRNGGRPKGVDEKKRKAALALKRDPHDSIKESCEIVGISR